VRLTTLGDLLLDVVVRLHAPLVHGDDQMAATRTGAGGQAANVAAWARALGADARFVGKRGDDAAGELVSRELHALGVDVVGPVGGRTGVVVSLASDGDRTMASDRGAAVELAVTDLEPDWFAAALARERRALVSIDVSTWTLVDGAFRGRVAEIAPDVLFATEREREALGDTGARLVLKRGASGLTVDGIEHAAVPTEVVDTTGAGDALAAGFLIGGPALGLEAAATCCARMGAMP
jgi:sugar/nucleoside kinase (ribokinase family)